MFVSYNGIKINNTAKCMWCGSEMQMKGDSYFGSGINSFTYFCDTCGAITINAKDSKKKIKGYSIEYKFED